MQPRSGCTRLDSPTPASSCLAVNGHNFALRQSVVLLLSHSGGTFATLAVANLLKTVSDLLFVATSEMDTPLARTVMRGPPGVEVHDDG
jgi:fructoselysine-6-P-deglycase FrlB-like protein